ncbi:hypothetical protein ACR3S4_00930 [Streptomyces sp. CH8.1]|uniref:hypothetical protein n=1 Tax=Streptomyces sp. CH8.1 TaxID=3439546 RepID=UPI003DA148EE
MGAEEKLRRAATRVVDLVLTEDCAYLDALPDAVEIEVVTPLSAVGRALDEGTANELAQAVGLFLSCAAPVAGEMPADLAEAVTELRAGLREYEPRGAWSGPPIKGSTSVAVIGNPSHDVQNRRHSARVGRAHPAHHLPRLRT